MKAVVFSQPQKEEEKMVLEYALFRLGATTVYTMINDSGPGISYSLSRRGKKLFAFQDARKLQQSEYIVVPFFPLLFLSFLLLKQNEVLRWSTKMGPGEENERQQETRKELGVFKQREKPPTAMDKRGLF